MTLNVRRPSFPARLAASPKVWLRNYRSLRPYARGRVDAVLITTRTVWILLRPLVDESRCRICHEHLIPGDGRLCPRCAAPAGLLVGLSIAGVLAAAIVLSIGCASAPALYQTHADTPLPPPIVAQKPCADVLLKTPGETCTVCLDEAGDREQIGRGRAEGCLHRVTATWGTPTSTPAGGEQ